VKLKEIAMIPGCALFSIGVEKAPDCSTDSEESMDNTQDKACIVPLIDTAQVLEKYS
jgi:hypothetical protein